jgi:hypothetical protein
LSLHQVQCLFQYYKRWHYILFTMKIGPGQWNESIGSRNWWQNGKQKDQWTEAGKVDRSHQFLEGCSHSCKIIRFNKIVKSFLTQFQISF